MSILKKFPAAGLAGLKMCLAAAGLSLVAGVIFLFLGAAQIAGSLAPVQSLDLLDPVFGLPFRGLMLFLGLAELVVAGLCLFGPHRILNLGIVAWLTASLLVYRVELWAEGWHHSCGFSIAPWDSLLRGTDLLLSLASASLFLLSLRQLWRERRLAVSGDHLKMFCPACGGHIQFFVQNLGREIPCPHCRAALILRRPVNLKMACDFCRQHVEFPTHALGRKIGCPHCRREITLRETT